MAWLFKTKTHISNTSLNYLFNLDYCVQSVVSFIDIFMLGRSNWLLLTIVSALPNPWITRKTFVIENLFSMLANLK